MKKSLTMVFAVMAILVLVVSACAPAATPAPTQPPATEAPTEVVATEAPTQAATEAPTAAPTEAATAAPPTATAAPPPACARSARWRRLGDPGRRSLPGAAGAGGRPTAAALVLRTGLT